MTVVTTCTIDQAPRDTAITDSYEYDAFGNKFTVSGTTPNNYLYRGEQFDSDLALYYLRARYYNPNTGRFLSRDPEDGKPVDPKSLGGFNNEAQRAGWSLTVPRRPCGVFCRRGIFWGGD